LQRNACYENKQTRGRCQSITMFKTLTDPFSIMFQT